MDSTTLVVILAVLIALVPVLNKVLKNKRGGSEKHQQILADFRQKVESELAEGEVIEGLCGYNPCAAVTDKRLMVSTKAGLDIVEFADIKALKGMNAGGNKTSDPNRMLVFEIKANKKYVLGNHSEGFNQVVESLQRHTGK